MSKKSGFRTDPKNRHSVHPEDVLRVDRQVLLDGPVALYQSLERLARHVEALESYGYHCKSFDCSEWESQAVMFDGLAKGLSFSDYHGHNLASLNDCLCSLEIPEASGMALVFQRFDKVAFRFPDLAWDVLDTIADAAWFHLHYGRRLLGLVQSDDPELQFAPVGGRPVCWISWECHPPGPTPREEK